MPHRKQDDFAFGMRVEHDMTSEHQLAQFRQTQGSGTLPRLLSLKPPPVRPGIQKPGRPPARGRERKQRARFDYFSLQLLEAH